MGVGALASDLRAVIWQGRMCGRALVTGRLQLLCFLSMFSLQPSSRCSLTSAGMYGVHEMCLSGRMPSALELNDQWTGIVAVHACERRASSSTTLYTVTETVNTLSLYLHHHVLLYLVQRLAESLAC